MRPELWGNVKMDHRSILIHYAIKCVILLYMIRKQKGKVSYFKTQEKVLSVKSNAY